MRFCLKLICFRAPNHNLNRLSGPEKFFKHFAIDFQFDFDLTSFGKRLEKNVFEIVNAALKPMMELTCSGQNTVL